MLIWRLIVAVRTLYSPCSERAANEQN